MDPIVAKLLVRPQLTHEAFRQRVRLDMLEAAQLLAPALERLIGIAAVSL